MHYSFSLDEIKSLAKSTSGTERLLIETGLFPTNEYASTAYLIYNLIKKGETIEDVTRAKTLQHTENSFKEYLKDHGMPPENVDPALKMLKTLDMLV